MGVAFRSRCGIFFSYLLREPDACRACRRAFASDADTRVAEVNSAAGTPGGCELFRASLLSPGRVSDEENLHYLVTEPQDQAFDPRSGKLLPGVLSQIDKKGISVLRQRASDDEFEITFSILKRNSLAKGKERFWHSVATAPAGQIRKKDGQPIAAVYDTSVKKRRNHADIMGIASDRLHKERRKKALLDLMNSDIVSTDRFRNGVFAQHARPAVAA
ncbi:hypothetical protein [Methylobacterium sp. 190mf]|uniref:hypothetical protein n=1 Tax=Methylobacterium sp. 190mf TaxID=1761798 RepID=UPI0011AFFB81|nr:hypothetical protein [Methylobacterium sp. 190mf]